MERFTDLEEGGGGRLGGGDNKEEEGGGGEGEDKWRLGCAWLHLPFE